MASQPMSLDEDILSHQAMLFDISNLRQQLLADVAASKAELENLRSMKASFIANTATPATAAPTATSSPKIKTRIPDSYDGRSRIKLPAFITQLQLYFRLQAHQFLSESDKLCFVATLLKDLALDWFQPHLEYFNNPDSAKILPHQIKSLDDFYTQIKQVFGPQEELHKNGQSLLSLRQTGSMSNYITQFSRLSSFLDLDEKALQLIFFNGLKPEVQSHISYFGRPDTLPDMIRVASEVDAKIYESNKFKSFKPDFRTFNQVNHSQPEPMDLDVIKTNPIPKSKFTPLTGKRLSAEEKQHRIANKLCLYCGKAGHQVNNCYGAKAKHLSQPKNSQS